MICLDASVAVKWVLPEEWSDRARTLYEYAVAADEPIIAPPLLPIEVTNILVQRTRVRNGVALEEASAQLARFLRYAIEIHNPIGLHQRALEMAHSYGLPAAYDAHYLALVEAFDCTLWTDDRRLLRAPGGRLASVRQISDYNAR